MTTGTHDSAARESGTVASGGVPGARHDPMERALAPDVARGLALLGIAMVNVVTLFLYGREKGPRDRLVEGTPVDHALDFVVVALVDNRAWPMFAVMFGFGIAAIAARLTAAGMGERTARAVLVRRNLWLAAFGLVQVVLVFFAVYGLTGLVVLLLLHRRPRVLLAWGVVSVALWGVHSALTGVGSEDLATSSSWAAGIGERLVVFGLWTVSNVVLLTHLAPMLVGVALHRAGVLQRPCEHRALLRRMSGWGAVIGVAGGVPLAVAAAGWWDPSTPVEMTITGLHAVTGIALGLASISLLALWADGRRDPQAPARGAAGVLAAAGQRPLTCYLTQSVLIGLLASPWGGGLGAVMSSSQAYAFAVAVWLVSVSVGWGLAVAGVRGPFEVLLRRLSYGRRTPAAAG
jgi:uncharacterized membrane protein YeiB